MRAVLLAAGRGTRMGALTASTPKPLLAVNGKPLLRHIVDGMAAAGVRDFVIVTGHLGEQIEGAFGDGSRLGLSIVYRRQAEPTGTAGALLLVRDLLGVEPFFLSWGDILVDASLYRRLIERFTASPCDVLLSVNPVDDPWRGAAVYVGEGGRVERIVEKPPRGTSTTGWNNAGVFAFSPLVLEYAARLDASPRGEYELPQAIARMVEDGHDVHAVPVGDLWSDVGTADDLRRASLTLAFRDRFGGLPEVIVSAPGRVNLIGEHTDYNGLPVLPMAIDRSILMASRRGEGRAVELYNLDARFEPRRYEAGADITPFAAGDWGNYHKAALQGLVRHLEGGGVAWHGGEFLAEGDVPSGAGLSSSSAFVVASGLSFLAVNGVALPRPELADLLATAERYVGTLSGGMDQAASLLARAGHALRIDFFPLRAEAVPLPAGVAFVVAHSLVPAEKSAGAREAYNLRVVECRIACRVMERVLGDSPPQRLERLGDLAVLFPGRLLESFVAPLSRLLGEEPLTWEQAASAAGIEPARLRQECEVVSEPVARYAVLRRARHVLSEADRVAAAVDSLRRGDVEQLGRLMLGSHRSCRDDYEVSCPELDELVAIGLEAGALGARLTGAGFGGCTVNLVRAEDVERFLEIVDRRFYAPRLGAGSDFGRHRFVLAAREGAVVERMMQRAELGTTSEPRPSGSGH